MLAARLVVGADGVGSAVRRAIGARSRMRTTGDGYLIGISPLPPADEAVMLYCGDGWCDGVVPLGDRSYFFDHVTGDNRDAVKRRDFEAWRAIYAGRFPQAARIAETLSSFDELALLTARTHVASPRRRPGTVLIGDAAAAVHPHNGQGANRALEDAWQLGRLLAAHGPLAHARIDRWAKVRERASRSQVGWSILIARIFDGPNPAWRVVRAGGYVLAKVPAIRNETTRRQAGLA
jgi:2-polyprenyl-6-methoxyphenol hydroxylase-like FAD-dependent oxidoreductase